ncbi:MAG: hypothetical protein AAGN82_06650 [Myxococcota bacterium]
MRPIFAVVLSVGFAAVGCHHAPSPSSPVDEVASRDEAGAEDGSRVSLRLPAEDGETVGTVRRPGDFCTLRFSGTYRDASVTLTQRVVARDGETTTLDLELEGTPRWRVSIDERPEHHGEVVAVSRHQDDGALVTASYDAYEQFMAELVLTADVNEGQIAEETISLSLGENRSVPATKSTFRVWVGDREATLETLAPRDASAWAWGDDAGGRIVATDDGEVLFRAEVVEVGRSALAGAFAAQSRGRGLDRFAP